MKRILLLFLISINTYLTLASMEKPPQPMQAESTSTKVSGKRAGESITPSSAKSVRIAPVSTLIPPTSPIIRVKRPYGTSTLLPSKAQRAEPISLPEKLKAIRAARFRAGLTAHLELPRDYYYDEETIEELVSQRVKLHAPGLIIIEPEETKSLTMADLLQSALQKTEMVIIASTAVFYRALEAHEKSDEDYNRRFENFFIRSDRYNLLYQSPDSNFVIFIPHNLLKTYQDNSISLGINFEKLKDLSSFLNVQDKLGNKKFAKLRDQLKDFPKAEKFNYQSFFKDFSNIFVTKQTTNPEKLLIWDFIIAGHGLTSPPQVAGLPIKEFNQLLTFFDKNLLIGTIIIETCMAGGTNLTLLEFEEWGVKKSHPFIFIITATTDSPTIGQYTGKYNQALSLAAWINDKGISLNRLLHFIPNISADLSYKEAEALEGIPNQTLSFYIRESLAIPQVWLPNGIGFQTYNIDQYVLVINNVMARAAFENRKPIVIENKRVVLIYPPHIKAPLTVTTWKQYKENPKEMNLPLAKTIIWPDMPMITEISFWNNIKPELQIELQRMLNTEYPFIKIENTAFSYIFPQFISMMRGDSTQLIDRILLAIDPAQGVIRFIRDAFLDKAERDSLKTFLIASLQGYNDILPLIHLARVAKGIKEIHPLEKILANKKDQAIELTDVLISTQFDPDNNKEIITVAFSINNTAWQFTYDDIKKLWPQTHLWNFTQIDPAPYHKRISEIKEYYRSFETGQKTISEVLEKKLREIKK